MDLESIDFDLISLINKVVEIFEPIANQKDLVLSADISAANAKILRGDAPRLRQVLLNLISNAIKFTAKGSVTLSVTSDVQSKEWSLLRFEVRDTGLGVSEDMKQRLFHPFEQADASTTRRFGGSGLGLSICKRMIELMNGKIGVLDRAGGGSVFWVEISLRNANARPAEAPAGNNGTMGDLLAAPKTGHILLAEDNEVNRELASMLLTSTGYTIDFAHDGQEAVEAMLRCKYDLVLMDVQMPNLDGLSATRAIRAMEGPAHRVPIIAMTANALKEDRVRCADAGMDDYIAKPFDVRAFRATVDQWMGKKSTTVQHDEFQTQLLADLPVVDQETIEDLRSGLSPASIADVQRRT